MPWTERTRRRLKLRDLEVLMSVIETGSMGKAAKQLGISQPGVSKAIVELEDALGVRLLDRSRRGIVATPYGLALQHQGAAVFNELRQAIQHIDLIADPTKGEIRIGTTEPLAISVMSPVIDALSREHPKMVFHMMSGGTGELYRAVADRRVEFALCRMIGHLPNELAAEILFHDAFAVMASAENPLTRRRKLDWADLADEPWTFYPPDVFFGAVIADAFRVNGLDLHVSRSRPNPSLFNAQCWRPAAF
jgi:DNA-binding transcriptional LysR family regulator